MESVRTAIIRIMSLCIDIEKFPSMFAVLKEVERQRNLRIFSAMVPDQGNIHKTLTRTTTVSKFRSDAPNKHHNAKRQSSDPTNSRRKRLSSTPESSTVDNCKPKLDGRFTAAARKLSKESFVCWKKTSLSQWTFFSFYATYERRLWVGTSYFSRSAGVRYKH